MIKIKRQRILGKVADGLMLPLMYLLQGNFRELPQRTHRWNIFFLKTMQIEDFDRSKAVFFDPDDSAIKRWFGPVPLFHIPILGGWKKFGVVQPKESVDEWFIGWTAYNVPGLSKIPLNGPVRIGIGNESPAYYGFDRNGEQIEIVSAGEGYIGKAGIFAQVPFR